MFAHTHAPVRALLSLVLTTCAYVYFPSFPLLLGWICLYAFCDSSEYAPFLQQLFCVEALPFGEAIGSWNGTFHVHLACNRCICARCVCVRCDGLFALHGCVSACSNGVSAANASVEHSYVHKSWVCTMLVVFCVVLLVCLPFYTAFLFLGAQNLCVYFVCNACLNVFCVWFGLLSGVHICWCFCCPCRGSCECLNELLWTHLHHSMIIMLVLDLVCVAMRRFMCI